MFNNFKGHLLPPEVKGKVFAIRRVKDGFVKLTLKVALPKKKCRPFTKGGPFQRRLSETCS